LRSGERILPLGSDPNFVFGQGFIDVLGRQRGARTMRARDALEPKTRLAFGNLMSSKKLKQTEIYAAVATANPSPNK
jgi:hypothetical protein